MAAVVNDEVITLSEVYEVGSEFIETRAAEGERLQAEVEVAETLIERELIDQELSNLGLGITQVELDRTIDDIARQNGIDRENLRKEIESSGLSWRQYQDEIRESLKGMKFSQAVIRPRIAVKDDELKDAYKRLVASSQRPLVIDLGAIFLAVEPNADEESRASLLARAKEAHNRIVAGESFEAVAADVDEGPFGGQGGKMGTYRSGELVGNLDRSAFSLKNGETSDPVEAPQGVFILHCFSLVEEDAIAFEDVKDKLFEQVYAARIEDEKAQWTAQARRNASVQVKLQ